MSRIKYWRVNHRPPEREKRRKESELIRLENLITSGQGRRPPTHIYQLFLIHLEAKGRMKLERITLLLILNLCCNIWIIIIYIRSPIGSWLSEKEEGNLESALHTLSHILLCRSIDRSHFISIIILLEKEIILKLYLFDYYSLGCLLKHRRLDKFNLFLRQ